MATRDGSDTSCHLENAESYMKLDIAASPDDVAWADSCLTNDPEVSEPNMDSLKEALMEFVSYHFEPLETSTSERRGSGIELGSSSEDKDTSKNNEIHLDEVPIDEVTEYDSDEEKTDTPLSGSYLYKAFLPSYTDEMREVQYSSDSDVELAFPEFAMETSSEDIFKVWDLGLLDEEDEFMKQLNKALANSSLKKVTSTFDGSAAGKGFEDDDSIDDLVASIAGLSLKQRLE